MIFPCLLAAGRHPERLGQLKRMKAGEITTPDEWIEAVRSFRKGVAKDCETQTKGND